MRQSVETTTDGLEVAQRRARAARQRGLGSVLETFSHSLVERFTTWLHVGQDLVLVGVAAVLLLAGLVVLFDTIQELFNAMAARNIAEAIFFIVENALLALILAELVHTLLVSLGGGALTVEPFLIIAIVGILRKMLLTTVLAPKASDGTGPVSPVVAELFLLGVLILVLGGALALARWRRDT